MIVDLHTQLQKEGLTFKESQVIYYVLQGLLNKDIAPKLFVAEKTVKWRLSRIYKKLGMPGGYETRCRLIIKYLPMYNEILAKQPVTLQTGELPFNRGVA